MPVLYNEKQIIPGPVISIKKRVKRAEDGSFKRNVIDVVAKGQLLAYKGSPNGSGVFYQGSYSPTDNLGPDDTSAVIAGDMDNRLELLQRKKSALCELFCDAGRYFEIQPFNGTAPIKFIPRVQEISFEEGLWHTIVPYTITMETDVIFYGDDTCCSSNAADDNEDYDETWSIEQADENGRSYKVTHAVSAQAYEQYDLAGNGVVVSGGWEIAREKVSGLLGIDSTKLSQSLVLSNLEDFTPYNYVRTENIDERIGKYSATETWLLYDNGNFYEEYTVNTRISADTNLATVSVEGTIKGLEVRDNTTHELVSTRLDAAQSGWTTVSGLLLNRAQVYSSLTLNATSINKTVGKNPLNGVITYTFEYTDKPTATVDGALYEMVTVQDIYPADVFARHICVARSSGPVLQDIGTQTEYKRNLTIEVQMRQKTQSYTPTKPSVTTFITENTPTASESGPFVERNEESWSVYTGRYTRNITWAWV